mgnify:FL=1
MNHTVEYIHHFTCEKCSGWWSIATDENWKPKQMWCPMCGTKQKKDVLIDVKTGELKYEDSKN